MRILLISTADWHHPFWTNKQYEAKALATLGHEVLYVEGLGLRHFSAAGAHDISRIFQRLRGLIAGIRPEEENISVVSPLVIPAWARPRTRRINELLLKVQLAAWRRLWGPWDVVWTFSPVVASFLADDVPILYHCVDDISAQPGMPSKLISSAEADLVGRASLVYTTSPTLTERVKAFNPKATVVEHTNCVDFEGFRNRIDDPGTARPLDLPMGKPLIGLVGALSRYKVDVTILSELADAHDEWDFVLIGQEGEGQPGDELTELKAYANVYFLGPRSRSEIPLYMANFDVGIIPAPINEYTRSMFPMKFFEYLASGIPVVSSPIPALDQFKNVAHIASSSSEFGEKIDIALKTASMHKDEFLHVAADYSYNSRAEKMIQSLSRSIIKRHA